MFLTFSMAVVCTCTPGANQTIRGPVMFIPPAAVDVVAVHRAKDLGPHGAYVAETGTARVRVVNSDRYTLGAREEFWNKALPVCSWCGWGWPVLVCSCGVWRGRCLSRGVSSQSPNSVFGV